MRRRSGALSAALVVTGTLAAPTWAAPPWSEPSTVAAPRATVDSPALEFGRGGTAILAWAFSDEIVRLGEDPRTQLATRATTGAFTPTRDVAGDLPDDVVAYGSTRAALLRLDRLPARTGQTQRVRLGVSLGRTDGDVDPQRVLDEYVPATTHNSTARPAIDANDRGQIAVAYLERRGERTYLRLAERRPDRGFRRPRVVRGSGQLTHVDVAYGEGGDLVVAYRRGERLEARVQRAGHALGDVRDLGPADDITSIDTAIAPTGRVVVAWGTQDGGEEPNTPFTVRATVAPAGTARFRDAVVLDSGGPAVRPRGDVAVDTARDGTASVAWSSIQGSYRTGLAFPVLASITDARAAFGPPQILAASGATGDVAARGDGQFAVAWGSLEPGQQTPEGSRVLASVRPPGGAFAAAELVADEGANADVDADYDPRTGRPTVVWPAPARPEPGSLSARSVVRASTRTGTIPR